MICGSLVSTAASTYAVRVNKESFPAHTVSLEINQELVDGQALVINHGSIAVSCRENRSIVHASVPNEYTIDNRKVNMLSGDEKARAYQDCTLNDRCIHMNDTMRQLSGLLASYKANIGNTVNIASGRPGSLSFLINRVNCQGVAIFNLRANQVFNQRLVNKITVDVRSTIVRLIVINLSGVHVTMQTEVKILPFAVDPELQIIWNFSEAELINVQTNMRGMLLAPLADVIADSPIEGTVAAGSFSTTSSIQMPSIELPTCI
jgi:choice-of-anchor A domain-containing protein